MFISKLPNFDEFHVRVNLNGEEVKLYMCKDHIWRGKNVPVRDTQISVNIPSCTFMVIDIVYDRGVSRFH